MNFFEREFNSILALRIFFKMEIGTFWTVGLMVTKHVNFMDWIIKMKDENINWTI